MRPELFSIAGVPFYAYRTLLAVSFVVCTLLAVRSSTRRPGGIELSPALGIWAMVGAIVGARAFFILQYGNPADVWRAVVLWEGGLVFYGGLIGGVLAAGIHLRLHKTPFLNAADSAAPYLALGEAIARIGCFCNGCCWGAVSEMPWSVRFPPGSPAFEAQVAEGLLAPHAIHALPVHPAQLYMSGALVVAALGLRVLHSRQLPAGVIFFGYLLLYGLIRFCVELVRGDSARSVGGLTVSGAISVVLLVTGTAACAYRFWQSRSSAV